jgi:hypothetical protein
LDQTFSGDEIVAGIGFFSVAEDFFAGGSGAGRKKSAKIEGKL